MPNLPQYLHYFTNHLRKLEIVCRCNGLNILNWKCALYGHFQTVSCKCRIVVYEYNLRIYYLDVMF